MADLAKPEYVSCTETSVTISTAGGEGVTVEYKEYPEDWSAAKSVAAAVECTVEELNPGSTYQFRLAQGEARAAMGQGTASGDGVPSAASRYCTNTRFGL